MDGRRLPSLGPRGEGWVAIQAVIFVVIALGAVVGPAWDGGVRMVTTLLGATLFLVGNALAIRGMYDLRRDLTPMPRPRDGMMLIEHGAYGLVRHPIYGGLIVGSLGWGLLTASPVSIVGGVVLLAFFDLKSRREEAWLVEEVPGYDRYRRDRRRLIPLVY
jgi:protein-S-isoprenylcysteine O-methyltransferase Ste14